MDSFASLFSALGGPVEVARHLKVTPDTVRKMVSRHAVRVKYWPVLIELAHDKKIKGITRDTLARIATEKAA
jgi:hypothetical protein